MEERKKKNLIIGLVAFLVLMLFVAAVYLAYHLYYHTSFSFFFSILFLVDIFICIVLVFSFFGCVICLLENIEVSGGGVKIHRDLRRGEDKVAEE